MMKIQIDSQHSGISGWRKEVESRIFQTCYREPMGKVAIIDIKTHMHYSYENVSWEDRT